MLLLLLLEMELSWDYWLALSVRGRVVVFFVLRSLEEVRHLKVDLRAPLVFQPTALGNLQSLIEFWKMI